MSRYFTYSAESQRDKPRENKYISSNIAGNITIEGTIGTWLIIINTPTITKFRNRFISADILTATIIIQRGILIFLIRSPRPTIEVILCVVISAKNVHSTIPKSRYTGKCGIDPPSLKNFTNTTYSIINKNSGRSSDHRYPKVEF